MPDTENLIRLSRLFNVSIDYLLDNDIESTGLQDRRINKKSKRIMGMSFLGIGLLGNLILFVLSTMIQVPVTKKLVMPDGSISHYGGGDVLGYSFWGFIETYRLNAILIILIILLVLGVFLIMEDKRRKM